MKRASFWFICFLLFGAIISCTRDTKQQESAPAEDSPAVAEEPASLDSPMWSTVYNEQTQKLELKSSGADMEGITGEEIVRVLNKKYSNIQLELVGQTADTIITRIPDALYLTQSIGTAGAEAYMAEVTFSLTELPGVKAVKFEFDEGDHAMPGVYTRARFNDFN